MNISLLQFVLMFQVLTSNIWNFLYIWDMTSYDECFAEKKVEKIIRQCVISCYKGVTWMIIRVHKCHFLVKAFIWVKLGLLFFFRYRALGQVSWRSQIHKQRPQQLDCLNYLPGVTYSKEPKPVPNWASSETERGDVTHVILCVWYSVYIWVKYTL